MYSRNKSTNSTFAGYSFGNVLADGIQLTPDKFFNKAADKEKSAANDSDQVTKTVNTTITTTTSCNQLSDSSEVLSSNSEQSNVIKAVPAEASANAKDCSIEDNGDNSPHKTSREPSDIISQSCAFSRRHIAQLEVNMFDLVGHHDTNTGS